MFLVSGNFAGGEHNGEALHDMPNRRVDGDRARHFDCCIDAAKLGVARFARLRSDRRRDLTAAMLILTAKRPQWALLLFFAAKTLWRNDNRRSYKTIKILGTRKGGGCVAYVYEK